MWQAKAGSPDPPKIRARFPSVICPFSPSCSVVFVASPPITFKRASTPHLIWPRTLLLSLHLSSHQLASLVVSASFSYQQRFCQVSQQPLLAPPHPQSWPSPVRTLEAAQEGLWDAPIPAGERLCEGDPKLPMPQPRPQVPENQGWQKPCSHPLIMHWETGLPKPMQGPFLPMPLQPLPRAVLTGPHSLGHMPGHTGFCCPGRGKSRLPYLQLLQDMEVAGLCVLLVHHKGRNFVLCKHKHTEGILAECSPDVPKRGWGPSLHPGSRDIPLDPSGDHCPQGRRTSHDPPSHSSQPHSRPRQLLALLHTAGYTVAALRHF